MTFRAVLMGTKARDTLARYTNDRELPEPLRLTVQTLVKRFDSDEDSTPIVWPEDEEPEATEDELRALMEEAA